MLGDVVIVAGAERLEKFKCFSLNDGSLKHGGQGTTDAMVHGGAAFRVVVTVVSLKQVDKIIVECVLHCVQVGLSFLGRRKQLVFTNIDQ